MIKDSKYVKINSVNPLYLIFKVNGYFEEINGNKCYIWMIMIYYDRIDVSEGLDVNKTSP